MVILDEGASIPLAWMVLSLAVLIGVGILVLDGIKDELTFCQGKDGTQEYHDDTWKKYLNCTEYNNATYVLLQMEG